MKKILLLSLVLGGCATRDYTELTTQIAEYGMQTYEDKKHGVICYVYRDADSPALSCLKVPK